jgi:hypothetical protein
MAVETPAAAAAGAATVPPFDQVAVAIAPGEHLVVRLPGVLLVVAVDATEAPAAAPSPPRLGGWTAAAKPPAHAAPAPPPPTTGNVRVSELIDLCRRVSAAGSRAPGRRLHDELKSWLPAIDNPPSFALAAATEEGLAVALVGEGVAEVPDLGLRLTSADGDKLPDGRPFLDRLVDWPPAALRLTAGSTSKAMPHPMADLEAGTVPGSAAVLSPAPAPAAVPMPTVEGPAPTALVRLPVPGQLVPPPGVKKPPVPAGTVPPPAGPGPRPPAEAVPHAHEHAHDHPHPHAQVPAAPAPEPAPPAELPAPVLSSSLLVPEEVDEPVREPLPVASGEQAPDALVQEPEDTRPKVKGFLCSRGHLNDPRVLFCNLCGIRMAEKTGVFIEGVRPPLGLLVFDNGATVSLDADYVLGREPETEERVQRGELRPLLVVDQTGGVSRHHAEIHLEGWDVVLVDTGSANGTLVAAPGAPSWASLVPYQPVRLTPGMAIRMGGRQFTFESPHGGS